jgi:hypothetical protein
MKKTGTTWVKVETRAEFCYMVAWCEDRGMGTPLRVHHAQYPIAIVIDESGGLPWWHDRMDRAATYVSFAEFLTDNVDLKG